MYIYWRQKYWKMQYVWTFFSLALNQQLQFILNANVRLFTLPKFTPCFVRMFHAILLWENITANSILHIRNFQRQMSNWQVLRIDYYSICFRINEKERIDLTKNKDIFILLRDNSCKVSNAYLSSYEYTPMIYI